MIFCSLVPIDWHNDGGFSGPSKLKGSYTFMATIPESGREGATDPVQLRQVTERVAPALPMTRQLTPQPSYWTVRETAMLESHDELWTKTSRTVVVGFETLPYRDWSADTGRGPR